MDENIKIYSEEEKIILSEHMLEKIKYLIKKNKSYSKIRIEDYKSEMDYSFFLILLILLLVEVKL